jgi:hypothetical protein
MAEGEAISGHVFQHYVFARRRCLYRLLGLRTLDAPRAVVRHEQLFLWAMRQMRVTGAKAPVLIPGYAENYQRFVQIHLVQGNA